ncbi:hypothetical protein CapIbe_011102 [Capra ibex]
MHADERSDCRIASSLGGTSSSLSSELAWLTVARAWKMLTRTVSHEETYKGEQNSATLRGKNLSEQGAIPKLRRFSSKQHESGS